MLGKMFVSVGGKYYALFSFLLKYPVHPFFFLLLEEFLTMVCFYCEIGPLNKKQEQR